MSKSKPKWNKEGPKPGTLDKSMFSDNEDDPTDDTNKNQPKTDTSANGDTNDAENSQNNLRKHTEPRTKDDFSYSVPRRARDGLLLINLILTVFTIFWMTTQQATDSSQIKSIVQTVVVEEGIDSMIKEGSRKAVIDFESKNLKQLKQKVTDVGNDSNALQERISSFKNQITEIEISAEIQLKHINKSFNSSEKELAKAQEGIGECTTKIEGIGQSLDKLNDSISQLSKWKNLTNEETKKVNEEVVELNKEVQSAKTQQQMVRESLESLQDLVANLSKEVQKLVTVMNATESLRSSVEYLMKSYEKKVEPNLFKKDYFLAAFMFFFVLVIFSLILLIRLYQRFGAESVSGTVRADRMTNSLDSRQILAAIPVAPQLDDAVCIISFYEDRQDAHKRLLDSTNLPNCRVICRVVRKHGDITYIPYCKVYLMCVEFSERHVIIEEPGLGLGSLHRTTYEAILKLGGRLIILYTRDPGSRQLKNKERFNNRIYPATHQPELVELKKDDRFFSVYDELTTFQKTTLRQKIAECLI